MELWAARCVSCSTARFVWSECEWPSVIVLLFNSWVKDGFLCAGEFMTASEPGARGPSDLLLVRRPMTSGSLGTGSDRLGVYAVNQATYLMRPRSQAKARSHLDEIATSGNYVWFLLFIIVCFAIYKHRLILKACKSPGDVTVNSFHVYGEIKKKIVEIVTILSFFFCFFFANNTWI